MESSPATELFRNESEFHLHFNCYSIRWKKHPGYTSEVASLLTDWELEVLQPESQQKRRHIVESRLGLLPAYTYPDAPLDRVVSLAKFMVCFFVADDGIDTARVSAEDAKLATSCYIRILEGALDDDEARKLYVENKAIKHQVGMFSRAWSELIRGMREHQKLRMAQAMIQAFEWFRFEANMLRSDVVPNLRTYFWLRRKTAGVMPFIVAIDYVNELGIEPEVFEDDRVKRLESIGVDHVAVVNDMHSFGKEWVDGNFLNIIPVIAYNSGCGLEEAFERAEEIVKELEREYQKLRVSVLQSELVKKRGVKEYVDNIGSWMSGNAEWSWITARYNGVGWVPPPHRSATVSLKKYKLQTE